MNAFSNNFLTENDHPGALSRISLDFEKAHFGPYLMNESVKSRLCTKWSL